ncbi:MAG: hypothetical protein L0228_11290 [Planctomycetes bacterium]|nr:hypothetical protein [Planctomycetota bacterium]
METVNVSVTLRRVTKDDAQYAIDSMEEIFNEYDVPDETRLSLWGYYQIFASDVLIRFGEFNPEIGYPEHNGRD